MLLSGEFSCLVNMDLNKTGRKECRLMPSNKISKATYARQTALQLRLPDAAVWR